MARMDLEEILVDSFFSKYLNPISSGSDKILFPR